VAWQPYTFGIAGLWRGEKPLTTEDTESTER